MKRFEEKLFPLCGAAGLVCTVVVAVALQGSFHPGERPVDAGPGDAEGAAALPEMRL